MSSKILKLRASIRYSDGKCKYKTFLNPFTNDINIYCAQKYLWEIIMSAKNREWKYSSTFELSIVRSAKFDAD